jgi:hypothetical protein
VQSIETQNYCKLFLDHKFDCPKLVHKIMKTPDRKWLPVPVPLHQRLKILAARKGVSMSELVSRYLARGMSNERRNSDRAVAA